MASSKVPVSARERERREQQRLRDVGVDDLPDERADDNDLIEDMTPEQLAASEAAIEAVNLDEVTTSVERIAITEWAADGEYDTYDEEGNAVRAKRFKPVVRVALIATDAPFEVQAKALQVIEGRKKGLAQDEYMYRMAEIVLDVWRMSEPEMTLKRLVKGMGAEKIGKLFTLFFNRQRRSQNT